jgi:hypothetical protein
LHVTPDLSRSALWFRQFGGANLQVIAANGFKEYRVGNLRITPTLLAGHLKRMVQAVGGLIENGRGVRDLLKPSIEEIRRGLLNPNQAI